MIKGGAGIDFVRSKFTNVLSKNRGSFKLVIIGNEINEGDEYDDDLSHFKYALII